MRIPRIYSSILFFLVFCFFSSAQNVKKLENERKMTLKRIETTNKMLNETKKSQKSSLTKLNILNSNIEERKTLINTINKEIVEVDKEVKSLQKQKEELNARLAVLKKDYVKLVEFSYLTQKSHNKMMFVFSGENFTQVYRRLRYLQEYAAYRKDQVAEIERINHELATRSSEISQHRATKIEVLQQRQQETKKIEQNKVEEQRMLSDLKKKEKKLRTQLKTQQEKANKLNKSIEQVIAKEIKKKEEERRKAAAAKKEKPGKIPAVSKEDRLISGNFEKNKGRLPWPVERGIISGRYGVHPHPVLKHVTTNNKGIYIQAPKGADARAVFDGEVVERFAAPGSNNAVIVRHGSYLTIYANLTQIYVKKGDKIKAKQAIGKIYVDDGEEDKTEMYFQLWKEKLLLNPEPWIVK